MAIVIEEEKTGGGVGVLSIITWIVVVGAVAGVAYFIFFKKPELIGQISTPANFKNTEQLSKISLNPKEVVDGLSKTFKQYTAPAGLGAKGRSNPFLGF